MELLVVSLAMADQVWLPLATVAVLHVNEYGAVVNGAPKVAPSKRNCTLATATLSVAVAETVIDPETELPLDGAVIDTEGAIVSAAEMPLASPEVALKFPAASWAVTR